MKTKPDLQPWLTSPLDDFVVDVRDVDLVENIVAKIVAQNTPNDIKGNVGPKTRHHNTRSLKYS